MHVLPPEEPRRSSNGNNGTDADRSNGQTSHYHYHAAGDTDERIRREVQRDFELDRLLRRESHQRAVIRVGGICLLFAGVFAVADWDKSRRASPSGDTAVQVTSEFRDGRWVATAKRVPATDPTATASSPVRPLSSYAGYAPNEEVEPESYTESLGENDQPDFLKQYRTEQAQIAAERGTAASRRCEGSFAAVEGLVIQVDGRTATLWIAKTVREGDASGQTNIGIPTSTGLRLNKPNGEAGIRLTCETDHMLMTMTDGTSILLPRVSREDAAATMLSWAISR